MNINRCTSLSSAEALQERWENVKERMGKLPMCFFTPSPFQPLHCQLTWPKGNVEGEDGDIPQVFSSFPLTILCTVGLHGQGKVWKRGWRHSIHAFFPSLPSLRTVSLQSRGSTKNAPGEESGCAWWCCELFGCCL